MAAGIAGVEVMPERNLGLTEPPAQKHLAAVHHGIKVAEAVRPLEFDAEFRQFFEVGAELPFLRVELGLKLGDLLSVDIVRRAPALLRKMKKE